MSHEEVSDESQAHEYDISFELNFTEGEPSWQDSIHNVLESSVSRSFPPAPAGCTSLAVGSHDDLLKPLCTVKKYINPSDSATSEDHEPHQSDSDTSIGNEDNAEILNEECSYQQPSEAYHSSNTQEEVASNNDHEHLETGSEQCWKEKKVDISVNIEPNLEVFIESIPLSMVQESTGKAFKDTSMPMTLPLKHVSPIPAPRASKRSQKVADPSHTSSGSQLLFKNELHPKQLSKQFGTSMTLLSVATANEVAAVASPKKKLVQTSLNSQASEQNIQTNQLPYEVDRNVPDADMIPTNNHHNKCYTAIPASNSTEETTNEPYPGSSKSSLQDAITQAHTGSIGTRGKPSLNIRRLQDQLLRELHKDSRKGKSRVKQLQEIFMHPESSETGTWNTQAQPENQENYMPIIVGNTKTPATYQQKPYRQWHRVSKCVTADSKYIISKIPLLPMMPEKRKDSYMTVDEKDSDVTRGSPPSYKVQEVQSTISTDGDSCLDSILETLGLDTAAIKSPVVNIQESPEEESESSFMATSHSLYFNQTKSIDKCVEAKILEESDEPFKATNRTTDEGNRANSLNNESGFSSTECENRKSPNKRENMNSFVKSRAPKASRSEMERNLSTCVSSLSLRDKSSVIVKDRCTVKSFSINSTSRQCKATSPNNESSSQEGRLKPFDSVSKVSQVTGPQSPDRKEQARAGRRVFHVITPPRGPTLRTATRNRNRAQSPRHAAGSNNSFSGPTFTASTSSGYRHNGRSGSRTASRHGPRNASRHTVGMRHCSRVSRAASRHADEVRALSRGIQCICIEPRAPQSEKATGKDTHVIGRLRKKLGMIANGSEVDHIPLLPLKPKASKVFRPDAASKLLQKVNRVHKIQQIKHYVDVQATVDYKGTLPGQLSFRKGQIIKQRSFMESPSDGISYGYYRVGKLRKKRKGLYPTLCVTSDIVREMGGIQDKKEET